MKTMMRAMELRAGEQGSEGLSTLTDEQLQAVSGGGETYFNAYYDASTGRYTLVPEGQVCVGAGMLVGPARLNS